MKSNTCSRVGLFALLVSSSLSYAQEAARVNDKIITNDQVNYRFSELLKQGTQPASRKSALEDLIKKEVALQEARRLKLDQDPQVVDRINGVLYYALLEKKLGAEFDRAVLSDAEARAWYEKNPEIRTSQIIINLPQGAKPEDEKSVVEKLNAIYRDIKSGKVSFGEAAQQHSEDPSSSMGGDMDYRSKDQLDPAYYRAAVKLSKPGEYSTPVRTARGVALIRLTAKRSWIEVDRSKIKRMILEEKRQVSVERYLNDLRQKAIISIK